MLQERAIRLEPEQSAHIVDQEPARHFVEKDAVYIIERGAEGRLAVDRIAMTVWQTGNRDNGLRTGNAQTTPRSAHTASRACLYDTSNGK